MTDVTPIGGDSFGTEVGEISGSYNVAGSKDTALNVANADSSNAYNPNIAITNAQQDQLALILFHVSNQNSLLNSLATKLDNHVTRVEDRFRALESTTGKLETAVNGMADRLRVMEKSNAELEHASDYRGRQTTQLESQLSEVRHIQNEMTGRLEALKNELQSLRADIPKHAQEPQKKERAIPQWLIVALVVALVIFVVGMFVLGWYLRGGA